MGRWIDFKNDYKTLYPWFMETVWYDEDDPWVECVFTEGASDAEAPSQFEEGGLWLLYSHDQKNTMSTWLPFTLVVSFPVNDLKTKPKQYVVFVFAVQLWVTKDVKRR